MAEAVFVGPEAESYPFRSLGLPTVTPPDGPADPAWVDELARGDYALILVSEAVLDLHAAAVESLWRRLDGRSALTIIPDPTRPRSEHIRFLRLQTTRSLGVDTWTRDDDTSAGANP